MYRSLLRPLLFALPPDTAHALAFLGTAPLEHLGLLRAVTRAASAPSDARLHVRAMGLVFPSPVGIAGGFDKNGLRPRALAALGFGHIEVGTVTAVAQEANPKPNLFRLPEDRALVNRLGFPNQGAEAVAARVARKGGSRGARVPVGMSIGKSRVVPIEPLAGVVDDYLASFRAVRGVSAFVVVNISSPNTKDLRAIQGKELAKVLLGALASENAGAGARVPLLVKIAPDLEDAALEDVLEVAEATRLDGVVATNTTLSRTGLATPPGRVEAIGAGGLSGPPLRARALEVVRRVRARLGKGPCVIGAGGVESAEHALAMMRAGANLVQMYTGFIYEGPGVAGCIARGILQELERTGAPSAEELTGAG